MDEDVKRILVLHGFMQNASHLKGRLGSLRKRLKRVATLDFVDAPHIVDDSESNSKRRGWWDPKKAKSVSLVDQWKDSEAVIGETIERNGPYDGIMGFSQGASALLLLLCKNKWRDMFKFAIFYAGFVPSLEGIPIDEDLLDIPSLHVYGMRDEVIAHSRSEELAKLFKNGTEISHEGGHFVPADKDTVEKFKMFIH